MEIEPYILWATICWLTLSLFYYLDNHTHFDLNQMNDKPTTKQLEKLKSKYQKLYTNNRGNK